MCYVKWPQITALAALDVYHPIPHLAVQWILKVSLPVTMLATFN